MKKTFIFLLISIFIISCDDGDKIVTNFDFDSDSDLRLCKVEEKNVLYIINSDPDEAIAFTFNDANFEGTFIEDDVSQSLFVDLEGNNKLIYRTFDASLSSGSAYFCSGIPPTEPKVLQEFESKNGGDIELTTYLIEEEINEQENTITRSFETYATAHNITLKNVNKEEEIVEETLKLGYFTTSATYDLEDFENQ